jgi:dTDP-4-dehydrorhamnose 3,5-epimerase
MKVTSTRIEGVLILEPAVFGDARGWFMESFNQQTFDTAVGEHTAFVQDNHTRSSRGVLRGMHYQTAPHAQGKLVRVSHGTVFDVGLDVRVGSATFGQWVGCELSGDNQRQFWFPPGIAHGFVVTSDFAEVQYKATAYYKPQAERSIRWDDPAIGIQWPAMDAPPLLSAKDQAAVLLADAAF